MAFVNIYIIIRTPYREFGPPPICFFEKKGETFFKHPQRVWRPPLTIPGKKRGSGWGFFFFGFVFKPFFFFIRFVRGRILKKIGKIF